MPVTMRKRRDSASSSDNSEKAAPIYRRERKLSTVTAPTTCKRKTSRECIKLVVAGDHSVGKSALTVRLLTKRFIGTYQHDKDIVYKTSQEIPNSEEKTKNIRLEILDSTGANIQQLSDDEGATPAIDRLYWSSATILVYDITNIQSFRYASNILAEIKREKPTHACLLLGNKTDLEHQRAVSLSEAEKFTASYSHCLTLEVSAASSDYSNVLDAFQTLLTLSQSVSAKTEVKRRRSLVDIAKAFTTLLKSGSVRHSQTRLSS